MGRWGDGEMGGWGDNLFNYIFIFSPPPHLPSPLITRPPTEVQLIVPIVLPRKKGS